MKRILALALVLCCFALPCCAAVSRVVDNAGLLSDWEENLLNSRMAAIERDHGLPVVILTTPTIGHSAVNQYAADAFERYVGREKDGLLFLLNMGERDYFTLTSGKAIRAFTDWGLDTLHEGIVPSLSRGDYYGAFSQYLIQVEDYMERYESGSPYDVPYVEYGGEEAYGNPYAGPYAAYTPRSPQERFRQMAPVILIVAFVIALIVVLCMKARMKTVRKKDNAASYVRDFDLTRVQDIYLYTTTTRRRIEMTSSANNGHIHGGSSTFHSSSGGHYGGRGGKF